MGPALSLPPGLGIRPCGDVPQRPGAAPMRPQPSDRERVRRPVAKHGRRHRDEGMHIERTPQRAPVLVERHSQSRFDGVAQPIGYPDRRCPRCEP